jgi:sensor c-di-GMP phosphodiesterase-like protein
VRKALALLVLVGAVIAHNVQSRREQDALRTCVTQAQGDLRHLLDKAHGTEEYAGRLRTSPTTPAPVRASLSALVTATVADELPLLRADRRDCDFWTLPWHGRERDAYVGYLDARLAQLQAATTDIDALHADPAAAARVAAQQALRDAGLTVSP